MVERALILAIVVVAVSATAILARWWLGRRLAGLRTIRAEGLWTALGTLPDGRPSLVVFSTPSCTVCRTAQYPAVETVEATYGSAGFAPRGPPLPPPAGPAPVHRAPPPTPAP